MTLEQLMTFCALAKHKSFSLAAEERCLSQPAVSVQIRELEREFGVRFFDRIGRRVILTQAGEIMLDCAESVLGRLEAVQQELAELQGLRRGKLTLGATQVIAIHVLPEILRSLKDRYPEIEFSLQIGFGSDIVDKVLDGVMDLAMVGEREILRDPRLIVRPLLEDELVVITSRQHPWSAREKVHSVELKSQPFIISRPSSAVWEVVEKRLGQVGVRIKPSMEFGSSDGVKKAVEVGLGISVMPRSGITKEDIELGRLKVLTLTGIYTSFDLCILWRKDRHLPVVVRAFLAFLEERGLARGASA